MFSKLLVLFGFCITLIQANESDSIAYPGYAYCEPRYLEKIQAYWTTNGRPRNVSEKLSNPGLHIEHHISSDIIDSTYKCGYIDVVNNIVNFTFTEKVQNGPPVSFVYSFEEIEDGILSGRPLPPNDAPEFRWKWYFIQIKDGVFVDYVCNDEKPSPAAPFAETFIASNVYNNQTAIEISNQYKRLLEGWGFVFNYTSSPDC